ncbi:unnamed protein product [Mytilus edulis]|uniref:Uncharacterized protein n=1 Tax=Mytilus edulis TaxID=6550 RepID=A0A8S3TIK7_MYTED|nr:unnamed protein product [Mytilus edulis]
MTDTENNKTINDGIDFITTIDGEMATKYNNIPPQSHMILSSFSNTPSIPNIMVLERNSTSGKSDIFHVEASELSNIPGSSVVDYCVVPYENLNCFKKFEVLRASELANEGVYIGSVEPRFIPDHSILCWEMESNMFLCVEPSNIEKENINVKNQNVQKRVIYDVKNIPNSWFEDENVINSINSCIRDIEKSNGDQDDVDNIYCEFVNIMHNEMNSKLNTKTKLLNSCNNKRRRFKKPWWSNDLTSKWNETCSAENQYLRCTNNSNKSALRTLYLNKRKNFDKLVQQSKRWYWHQ